MLNAFRNTERAAIMENALGAETDPARIWEMLPRVADEQLRAGIDPIKYKVLRQQAEMHEQHGDWDKACLVYESMLRLDRALPRILDPNGPTVSLPPPVKPGFDQLKQVLQPQDW